jgi:hypothetical protein
VWTPLLNVTKMQRTILEMKPTNTIFLGTHITPLEQRTYGYKGKSYSSKMSL